MPLPSVSPKPTPSATPVSITEQLRKLLVEQRGGTPIARYTGMDAFAQDQAEHGPPAFRGQYASVTAVLADTPSEAAPLITTDGYDKIGIGYDDGYWVIVLN